jgi:hypothetical protein
VQRGVEVGRRAEGVLLLLWGRGEHGMRRSAGPGEERAGAGTMPLSRRHLPRLNQVRCTLGVRRRRVRRWRLGSGIPAFLSIRLLVFLLEVIVVGGGGETRQWV